MKIAAFNVENLFNRPRAFNLENAAEGSAITDAVAELNRLINKDDYSAADKARMLELIAKLKLTSPVPPYAIFRKIRGNFWKSPAMPRCRLSPTTAPTGWAGSNCAPNTTMPRR